MTKREFFEKELKVMPSEIGSAIPMTIDGEKEVTERWLIAFIKHLIEDLKKAKKWHTETPTETGEYLVCIRYDLEKFGHTTANYVEPFNPHSGWYNIKPPSEVSAEEWCKKNGIEVIAWQGKIEPFKG